MFSITISEKGGAERREAFEKTEINIGRVQGNDLMLPKGNVSKHHARLLFRDGRFIVTDLKSTNGTYVNGRKIAQATIVREGDKIYIGDFVLRIESAAGAPAAAPAPVQEPLQPTPAAFQPPPPSPYDGDELETNARERNSAPRPGAPSVRVGPPPIPPQPSAPIPSPMPPMAAPPGPMPGHLSPRTGPSPISVPGRPMPSAPPPLAAPSPIQVPPAAAPPPQVTASMNAMNAQAAVPAAAPPGRAGTPSRIPPRESPQAAARRLALVTLVDRVADAADLAPLRLHPIVDEGVGQRLDRTVREQAAAMRNEGEVPEGIDADQLIRDATRELVALGPIGPLLEDDDVTEIHAIKHDHVFQVRAGILQPAEVSFTSEEAIGRAIARLAHQSGEPLRGGETMIERRLPRGHLVAIMPPAASGHALIIRKRRRVDASLEELVRLGAASRAMATFLENCMAARANVFVCGPQRSSVSVILSALTMASGAGERIVAAQDIEECSVPHAYVLSVGLPDLGARGDAALRAAARLAPERLVISPMAGGVALAALDVIAEGAEGVLAACVAPSLRQALARIVGQVAVTRAGGVEATRESLGESFDVAVEVVTLSDGRARVVRVAELAGSDAKGVVARDLFTSTEDGSFAATGVVPRAVTDFAARGVKVDPNLFKRAVGR
jgi:pilus assembly protein CpaF